MARGVHALHHHTCWDHEACCGCAHSAHACSNYVRVGCQLSLTRYTLTDGSARRSPLRLLIQVFKHLSSRALRAQATGAAAFHAAGVPVRDAVFFSSTAAVWSQSGAGHYAAANCALDALAARRQAAGLPGAALQLGPFRDVGMAALHADALAALGLGSLWPREVCLTLTLCVRG